MKTMLSTPDERRREGERRKDAAHALLAAHREKIILRARRALVLELLANETASMDDVRAVVELPPGIDPKCFGVVPGLLARAGIIRMAFYAKSTRPEAHRRPLAVWQLADRTKAMDWLRYHPEPDGDDAPPGYSRTLWPIDRDTTPQGKEAGL